MARQPRLKVFRTPIGFHDAYVAAPSQKAALAAWGARGDLFARGAAERVEDPELTREPLAQPGKVIRRLRATSAEQIAALPAEPPRKPTAKPRRRPPAPPSPKPPAKPRPDRAALDAAEREITAIEARHRAEQAALARRRAELDAERRALDQAQRTETASAEHARDKARAAYEKAMRAWRG